MVDWTYYQLQDLLPGDNAGNNYRERSTLLR